MLLRCAALAALLLAACNPPPPPLPEGPPPPQRAPEPSATAAPPPSMPDETSDDAVCKAIHTVLKAYPDKLTELAGERLKSIAEPHFASKTTVPGATEAYLALPEAPLKPRWEARWTNGGEKVVTDLTDRIGKCSSLKGWTMARGDSGEVRWAPPGSTTALVKVSTVAVGAGIVSLTVGVE